MKTKNPPAFARAMSQYDTGAFEEHQVGMTLRDYFAAAALQGLMASDTDGRWSPDEAARWAHLVADAMLTQRLLPKEKAS